jgi:hypothetical protein
MTAQAGMIFNFLVVIVVHHLWGVIVIMALGAADRLSFAFLNGEMTVPAGSCLIVVDHLLMTSAAIPTVKFLEFGMLEIFWFVIVVALLTGDCLSGAVESVMAGGAGISFATVGAVVKQHVAGAALQIISVGRHRCIPYQAADEGDACSDQQGNCHR